VCNGDDSKFASLENMHQLAQAHLGEVDMAALFSAVRVAQNGGIGKVRIGVYLFAIPSGAVYPKGHPKAIAVANAATIAKIAKDAKDGQVVSLTDKNLRSFTGVCVECTDDEADGVLKLRDVKMVDAAYQPLVGGSLEVYDQMAFKIADIVSLRKRNAAATD
jgi:hypothetical protein